MTWQELTDDIALRVWCIECADMMIPKDEALRRWEAMPSVNAGNHRTTLLWTVGCALIALKDRGLIAYD